MKDRQGESQLSSDFLKHKRSLCSGTFSFLYCYGFRLQIFAQRNVSMHYVFAFINFKFNKVVKYIRSVWPVWSRPNMREKEKLEIYIWKKNINTCGLNLASDFYFPRLHVSCVAVWELQRFFQAFCLNGLLCKSQLYKLLLKKVILYTGKRVCVCTTCLKTPETALTRSIRRVFVL